MPRRLVRCCALAIVTIAALGMQAQLQLPYEIFAGWPGPREVAAGSLVFLRGSIGLGGPISSFSGAGVWIDLPPGLTVIRIEPAAGGIRLGCSLNATTASCSSPMIAGDFGSFDLVVQVPAATPPGTTFILPATFSGSGPTVRLVASISTPPAPRADLRVTHSGPATLPPNSDVTWTTTVTNAGPAAAQQVRVEASFSSGITSISTPTVASFSCQNSLTGTGPKVVCDRGTIGVGESVTFLFTGRLPLAPAGTPVRTSASVSSAFIDPVMTDNRASANGVISAGADVRISKVAQRRGVFEIVVTNDGPEAALNVAMTDALPYQVTTFQSVTQLSGPPFTCTPSPAVGAAQSVSCTAATLGAGASATFAVAVDIPPGTVLPIRNEASVSATNDANGANNVAVAAMDPAMIIPALSPAALLLLAAALSAAALVMVRR